MDSHMAKDGEEGQAVDVKVPHILELADENSIDDAASNRAQQKDGVDCAAHVMAEKVVQEAVHVVDTTSLPENDSSDLRTNSQVTIPSSDVEIVVALDEETKQIDFVAIPQSVSEAQPTLLSEARISQSADIQPMLSDASSAYPIRSVSSPHEVFLQDTDEGESDDSNENDCEPSHNNPTAPPKSLDSPTSPGKTGQLGETQCASSSVVPTTNTDSLQSKTNIIATSADPGLVSSIPGGNTQANNKSDFETVVKKFGLSSQDKVLESFSCALYPKKGLLTHGRMFIMQHYVAFSGWKDMRVLLPMSRIDRIEKTNTLLYIPNALSICMQDKSEYFFGSFIDRDACVGMLSNLVQIERRIMEIHGGDILSEKRGLEFGYQSRQTSTRGVGGLSFQSLLMGGGNNSASGGVLNSNASRSVSPPPGVGVKSGGDVVGGNSNPVPFESTSPSRLPPSAVQEGEENVLAEILSPSPLKNVDILRSEGIGRHLQKSDEGLGRPVQSLSSPEVKCPPSSDSLPFVPAPPSSPGSTNNTPSIAANTSDKPASVSAANPSPSLSDSDDAALFKALFSSKSISWLLTREFADLSFNDLFKPCWLYSCGYGDFLRDEGAQDLKYTEWALNANGGNGTNNSSRLVEEDTHLKLQYSFCREFIYAFPRTTMLMFGPKLAPIKQSHYLHLTKEGSDAKSLDDLESAGLRRAVVLFVTKFDGIPMADVFKVLQYWVLEERGNGVYIQVGVAIHYVKSTMFKGQILSGTKEEVGVLLKRYETYAALRGSEFVKAERQQQQKGGDSNDGINRRRLSYRRPSLDQQAASALVSGTSSLLAESAPQAKPEVVNTVVNARVDLSLLLEQPYVYVVSGVLLFCLLLLIVHTFTLYRLAAIDAKLTALVKDVHRALNTAQILE